MRMAAELGLRAAVVQGQQPPNLCCWPRATPLRTLAPTHRINPRSTRCASHRCKWRPSCQVRARGGGMHVEGGPVADLW